MDKLYSDKFKNLVLYVLSHEDYREGGNQLWEIRLNIRDRIVFVERDSGQKVIWLKVVGHDELIRKNTIHAKGDYKHTT